MDDKDTRENIAQTLAKELPEAKILHTTDTGDVAGLFIVHAAMPKTSELKEIKLDLEKYLPHPRRTEAKARFSTIASFLEYVKRHANDGTVAWCTFNPQTFDLDFTAVFDEHTKDAAGWRSHRALFAPDFSAEWKAWNGMDKKAFSQIDFAQWIQEHDDDIAVANGLPSSLQMLEMATNFVMNEERTLKSAVRLQSGGMRLTYVADADKGTTEEMRMFERFGLGVPVFHGCPAWSIGARLKYRNNSGKLSFHYELIRADRVHDGAAKELIEQVRAGLEGVPLLMGKVEA